MHYGQYIAKHSHGDLSLFSANLTVSCHETSTVYEFSDGSILDIKNSPGTYTIFPSTIVHWTTKNLTYKERISVAMDFYDDNHTSNDLLHVMSTL